MRRRVLLWLTVIFRVGWFVSAPTEHEGNREVVEQVKIVVER